MMDADPAVDAVVPEIDLDQLSAAMAAAAETLIFARTAEEVSGFVRSQGYPDEIAALVASEGMAHPLVVQGRKAAERARKRAWLLDTQERHQELGQSGQTIPRRHRLDGETFLKEHYSAGRPVILTGVMQDWPALANWSPEWLKARVGHATVDFQGDRDRNRLYEQDMESHRRSLPFSEYLDFILQPNAGNRAYITAYNSDRNASALAPLAQDLGFPSDYLTPDCATPNGMMWVGPAGTFTPLHHDLTDNLLAQVVGRKRLLLAPAADVDKLYNHRHVYSEIQDLRAALEAPSQFPELARARVYEVTLMPGEMIFLPIGWWHQVSSLDFSVSITYTNFRWRNDWCQTYG